MTRRASPKFKDPGSFTIPIKIRRVSFRKALCELGARINLMPLSIYKRLSLRELKETRFTLQLVNRSLVRSKGVLEDVLVSVRQFIFLIDFIVLHLEEDLEIPILLGRPFLASSIATIEVEKGELTTNIEGETEIFKCIEPKLKSNEVLPSQWYRCQPIEMRLIVITNLQHLWNGIVFQVFVCCVRESTSEQG